MFAMRTRNVLPGLGLATILLWGGGALSQSASNSDPGAPLGTIDCAEITVDYAPDPNLTPEEDLARMDAALNRSLNQFDACQIARMSNSAGGGEASGGGGYGGSAGGDGSSSGLGSTASSDMAGSQKPSKALKPAEQDGSRQYENANLGSAASQADVEQGEPTDASRKDDRDAVENGKVPEDIPPADNDSVLEAQIRKAAMNEKDPEVRARLWDEYRKYKGIEKDGG